jgi:hypothetical protein
MRVRQGYHRQGSPSWRANARIPSQRAPSQIFVEAFTLIVTWSPNERDGAAPSRCGHMPLGQPLGAGLVN